VTRVYDDAVVGAGILGLAHAYHLARQGRSVVVFERRERASGASVRNFGMLWPIGQPVGELRDLALRSLEIWLEVLRQAAIWHERTGSLHLAYHDDEVCVLEEFAALNAGSGLDCRLIEPGDVRTRAPAVRALGLKAALWSARETCVDPREVVAGLPGVFARRLGVDFAFGRAVLGFDGQRVHTSDGAWAAGRLWVCSGDDLQTLYPELLRAAGLVRCKLQMMRSEPVSGGRRLGPMLAGGLTLRHYKAFEACPSLARLKARVAAERPELDHHGIHVLVAQNGRGEIVIGDSHEYDAAIEPFDKSAIDDLILGYLGSFLAWSPADLQIAQRWHGIYVKHPAEPYIIARPAPGVTIVTGVGGAGMTLAFGLAERVVMDSLDRND
jgi:FAD dependent oxidoreductase TIGR03364